jgi:selenocysteine lyase/cysteine desulfurase
MFSRLVAKNLASCRVLYPAKMKLRQAYDRNMSKVLSYRTFHDVLSLKDSNNALPPVTGSTSIKRPIYMDYQATTPVDIRVLDAMMPFLTCMYGNPHSRTHSYGWEAEHYVEKARQSVSSLLNCEPKEVIFTSGATESNNLAIKGLSWYFHQAQKKNHIITTQIEHKCLLASCRDIQERLNWDVTYLPVDRHGLVNLDQVNPLSSRN